MNKIVLIQKKDIKSIKWREHAYKNGVSLIAQTGSTIKAPLFLIVQLFKNGIPAGYVVRYLNDYPSIFKTLLRTSSEGVLILMCKILRVNLFWICHNVDKETTAFFPTLSKFRRNMFAYFSKRIFVTDKLLVPFAREKFPKQSSKIDFITFGKIDDNKDINPKPVEKAIEFIKGKKDEATKQGMNFFVVFCAGSPNSSKYLHFDYLENLIIAAHLKNIYIAAIIAGNFDSSLRSRNLLSRYKTIDNICLFEKYTRFTHDFVREYIDFYWRAYSDWSVPFTVYEAATLRKTMLVLDIGFFKRMVNFYHLGTIINFEFDNIEYLNTYLRINQKSNFDNFLLTHTWDSLSLKIRPLL